MNICTYTYTYTYTVSVVSVLMEAYSIPQNIPIKMLRLIRVVRVARLFKNFHALNRMIVSIRYMRVYHYGVASISGLLEVISLFCKIWSHFYGSLAKQTCNFKEPTNRSHPICIYVEQLLAAKLLDFF